MTDSPDEDLPLVGTVELECAVCEKSAICKSSTTTLYRVIPTEAARVLKFITPPLEKWGGCPKFLKLAIDAARKKEADDA